MNCGHWPVTTVYCSFYSDKTNLVSVKYMAFYRGFAAAHLLELRSRILPGAYTSLFGVMGFQIDLSVTGRSLVKRSPTESGETERHREGSKMRKPIPTRCGRATKIVTN